MYTPLLLFVILLVLLVILCKKHSINNYLVDIDILLFAFQALLHVLLILKDPGILPITKDISKQKANDEVYCNTCNIYAKRSDDLYHCAICDICVSQSEYHCAWIGKCVGKNNHFCHNLFVGCVVCYLGLTAIILMFIQA